MRKWKGCIAGLAVACALSQPLPAHAAKFANQFLEFELPPGWSCAKEAGDWLCDNGDAAKKRDAVIVFAAKLKGPQDTLDSYRNYLNAPRKFKQNDKEVVSEPQYVRDKMINDHVWIDSRHVNSEVPGFYTRYLATVENDIGVLITWSVDKKKYAEYEEFFDKLVVSMKVFRKQSAPAPVNNNILANQGISSTGIFSSVDPNTGQAPVGSLKRVTKAAEGGGLGLLIVLAAAAGGFFYWKKKKAAGN